jgi:L-asparaginase / beta-aspartyl-peptidase
VIGAGTFANNRTCAISATGTGEHFIRGCVGYDIHARMHYRRQGQDPAMAAAIRDTLTTLGGEGGMIGIGAAGGFVTWTTSAAKSRIEVSDISVA